MCNCQTVDYPPAGCCTIKFPYPFSNTEYPSSKDYTVPANTGDWRYWYVPNMPDVGTTDETKPHKCPVCEGRGIVPPFFYNISGAGSSCCEETCRSCKGLGYIIC
jgi:hypothetical protein